MASTRSHNKMYRLEKTGGSTKYQYHDVILSYDTTGSMSQFIAQLREDMQKFIPGIFEKYADVQVGIIAHGDYCDFDPEVGGYTTRSIDFTRDIGELQKFVEEVENTHGGDEPECYELVLKRAREDFSWREGSKRQLIMFGDATPHEYEDYPDILEEFYHVEQQLDWREEADNLLRMGVEIVPMQFGKGKHDAADRFWEELAYKTYSWRLEVNEPEDMRVVITAAVYRGRSIQSYQEYIQEIQQDGSVGLPDSISMNLERLKLAAGSTLALAPSSETTYVTETEGENHSRIAELAAHRMENGINYTFASVIPKEKVEVGIDLLGTGAGSMVWSGLYNGAKVAIKKAWGELSPEEEEFSSHVARLRRLKHDNIAVVFGNVEPFDRRTTMMLIMEMGDNNLYNAAVKQVKGTAKIQQNVFVGYLADAAEGLAYLHKVGVVHKAVRPSCILIVGNVGKLTTSSLAMLNQENIVRYKPIELWEGEISSSMSDVWSMGITILEVLAGTEVYKKMTTNAGGQKMPEELKEKKLPDVVSKLEEGQCNLVMACLMWDAETRITSREIANRLRNMRS